MLEFLLILAAACFAWLMIRDRDKPDARKARERQFRRLVETPPDE